MIGLALVFTMSVAARAGEGIESPPSATGEPVTGIKAPLNAPATAVSANTHYGLFDWLDHRSAYGQGPFPEPFLVDDSDGETNEARLDWIHTGGPGTQHTDLIHGEVEKGFGPVTLELETAFETDSLDGQTMSGMDNIDLGARCPFYQYVSRDGMIDSTFGVAFELGIPVHTQTSHNFEVVPKIFNDLKIGENFTIQTVLGYSTLVGDGGDDGGLQSFEYGFVFGYSIEHKVLPIPGVQQLIPVFELNGSTDMNKDNPGHNSLTGDIGFRANLDAIGQVQPRLGVVFIFPIDEGSQEDQNWGVDTSLVFEY